MSTLGIRASPLITTQKRVNMKRSITTLHSPLPVRAMDTPRKHGQVKEL